MKRILSLVLACAMVLGIAAVAHAPAEAPLSLQEWHARGLA